jgi:putative signal transducing protein
MEYAGEEPVVVRSFTGTGEAAIARGMLEAEGIPAVLRNEHLVAIAWPLSQATGGVSLAVPARDAERARRLLDSEVLHLAEEPGLDDGDARSAGDSLAERAWKSALVGFLAIPPLFHFWSLWLLGRAWAAGGPRTERGRSCARRALVVSGCMAVASLAVFLRKLVS